MGLERSEKVSELDSIQKLSSSSCPTRQSDWETLNFEPLAFMPAICEIISPHLFDSLISVYFL
jgi:hypothetical protein